MKMQSHDLTGIAWPFGTQIVYILILGDMSRMVVLIRGASYAAPS